MLLNNSVFLNKHEIMAYYRIISFALLLYSCQNFTRKESNIKSTDLVKEWISLSPEDNFNGWHIFQNENGSKRKIVIKLY